MIRSGVGFYANEPSVTVIQSFGQNPRPNALAVSYLSDPAIPSLSMRNPFSPVAAVPGAVREVASAAARRGDRDVRSGRHV